jgi:hypothetical protein
MENDILVPGTGARGVKVVDFSNILKYRYFPLADSLHLLLNLFKEAMGVPVELEYTVDLENTPDNGLPTLYLLQIKPLIRKEEMVTVDIGKAEKSKTLMYATAGMGNGINHDICDVVYVDIASFDRTRTREIARELGALNEKMADEKRDYILIGPGRWGSRDPFTGIPVVWSQISKAKVIVEMGLEDFPLDASLGSHFFHNVTSMNVGYYSVPYDSVDSYVNIDLLKSVKVVEKTNFVKHLRFEEPLEILMDGRERKVLISQK